MRKGAVNDFRDLAVWQRAVALTRVVYALTGLLPACERYRLADQMRRSAASIGANIAEGNGKPYRLEYLRYLSIAYGSAKELQHHLLLAEALDLLQREQVADAFALTTEVCRMLRAMHRKLARGG